MKSPLLLDTCAVVWTALGEALTEEALTALNRAARDKQPVFISPISAWEIGMLAARQRLTIAGRPQLWFSRVLSLPGVSSAYMPEELLIESSFLPGDPPGDPADRIIITTAREYGYTLVTRDRKMLDYAKQGHVKALAC